MHPKTAGLWKKRVFTGAFWVDLSHLQAHHSRAEENGRFPILQTSRDVGGGAGAVAGAVLGCGPLYVPG